MTVFKEWPCAEGEISRYYLGKNETLPPLAVNFLFTSLLPIFFFWTSKFYLAFLWWKKFFQTPKGSWNYLKEIQITVERNFLWNFLLLAFRQFRCECILLFYNVTMLVLRPKQSYKWIVRLKTSICFLAVHLWTQTWGKPWVSKL